MSEGIYAAEGATAPLRHRALLGSFEWIILAAIAGIIIFQILLPPIIGLADNGDYDRIMAPLGLKPVAQTWGDKYFLYVNRDYEVTEKSSIVSPSSEILIGQVALQINRLFISGDHFDIRVLGFLHMLLYLTGVFLILRSTNLFSWPLRITIGLILLVALTDVAYVSYFNSFYQESASLAFLVILVGIALLDVRADRPSGLRIAAYTVVAAMFISAKLQNSLLAFPLAAYPLLVWWHRSGSQRVRILILVADSLLISFAVMLQIKTPPAQSEPVAWNTLFYSILPNSPTPGQDLAEFGLEPDLAKYAGTAYWDSRVPFYQIAKRFGSAQILRFYVRHPDRLVRICAVCARSAFEWREPLMGNFTKDSGKPPRCQDRTFAIWSTAEATLLPKSFLFICSFLGLVCAGCVSQLRRNGLTGLRGCGSALVMILALSAMLEYLICAAAEGPKDIVKHLFMFQVLFDACLVSALAYGIGKLSRSLSRSFPRSGFISEVRIVKNSRHIRLLLITCLLSLGTYLCFSRLIRLWLQSLSYHEALWKGILPNLGSHLRTLFWFALLPSAWNRSDLLLLAAFLALCISAAELTRRLMGGHLDRLPALTLFGLAYAILPQLLLALIFWPDGRGRITSASQLSILAIAVFLQAMLLLLGRRLHRSKASIAAPGRIGAWGYIFLVPAVLLMVFTLISGLISVEGADAIGFHLPLAAKYRVTGSITTGADVQFLNPANPELVIRWFLTPGNDHLANLVSFLSAVLCLAVFYKILRAVGKSRQAATVAASCLIAIPVIPYLSMAAYTDTAALLFILLSIYYMFTWMNTGTRDWIPVLCCGLSVGLSVGSKLTMMPSAALVVLCCLVALWRTGARTTRVDSGFGPAAAIPARGQIWIFLLSILPGCLYWFIRNLVFYGNPFYPVAILGLPGYSLEYVSLHNPEFYQHTWKVLAYPWTEFDYANPFDQGIGAVFAAIVVPLAVWWPFHMVRNWKAEKYRSPRIFLYLMVGAILIYTLPRTLIARYGIVAIVLSFFLIAEAWSYIASRSFRIVVTLTYALMLAGLFQAFAGGILYHMSLGFRDGAARFDIPPEVDRMPPAVILNAAGGEYTYGLLGTDYRHDVITFFRAATPEDAVRCHAQFVYVREADLPKFTARLKLEKTATSMSAFGDKFTLCRIIE